MKFIYRYYFYNINFYFLRLGSWFVFRHHRCCLPQVVACAASRGVLPPGREFLGPHQEIPGMAKIAILGVPR